MVFHTSSERMVLPLLAMLLVAPRRFELVEVPLPIPGPGEVRIKVAATGLCGSDRRIYRGEYGHVPFPIVMGHEFCGTVEALGEGVDSVPPGENVVVNPPLYCRLCDYCRSNRENYCEHVESYGLQRPGGFAQFVTVRAENVFPAPGVETDLLHLAEPLACVLHGLERAGLTAGEKVAVLGAGPIGLLAAQVALAHGAAAVLILDRNPGKLAVARSFSAQTVTLPREGPVPQEALPSGWRTGADVVVEATGAADLFEFGFSLCRMGGRLLLLGVYGRETRVGLMPYWAYRREISILGSFAQRYEIQRAVELLRSGRLRLAGLITHYFSLAEVPQALDLWERPGERIKVVIHPNAGEAANAG